MKKAPSIFEDLINGAVREVEMMGCYMPSIATILRLKADELAERYPDDANDGLKTGEEG